MADEITEKVLFDLVMKEANEVVKRKTLFMKKCKKGKGGGKPKLS